jgi:3-ketosteroid 9alpha-monooxygenase subunit A
MSSNLEGGAMASAFAKGWYLVSWSADLAPGAVVPKRYFARDLVLFRREDGAAALFDAHCPHMGAHLGHGGRVDGDDIVCPFHAWQFGRDGRCSAIPYASKIPSRARIRSYSVVEHSGMILAWFGADGVAPEYDVPVVPEIGHSAWTPLQRSEIEVATQPREVIENVADLAHFKPVHNQLIDEFEMTLDGPRATQRTVGRGFNLRGEPIPVETVATYHGPAVQFTRLGWAFDMVLVNSHVPIDEDHIVLRFGVAIHAGEGVTLHPQIIEAHAAAAREGYFQDVAIWEHKRWRDPPLLVKEDGPIGKLRTWYRTFYADGP